MRYLIVIAALAIVELAGCSQPVQRPTQVTIASSTPTEKSESWKSPASARPQSLPPQEHHLPLVMTSLPSRFAIVRSASRLVGARTITSQGKRIAYDCAGVARAIFLEHGIDLYRGEHSMMNANGVRLIHDHVRQHGLLHQTSDVSPGDLVFFDNTWDFNGDGQLNDPLTHVGIVEHREGDGTVIFISRVAGAIERYRMNLDQPHVHRTADGRVLNDYIRRKHPTDPGNMARLTGELFSSYGNLLSPQNRASSDGPHRGNHNHTAVSMPSTPQEP